MELKKVDMTIDTNSNGEFSEGVIENQQRKEVTVKKFYHARATAWTGTVEELVENVFKDYLQSGWEFDHKIDRNPKSGEALVEALNKVSKVKMRHAWTRVSWQLC